MKQACALMAFLLLSLPGHSFGQTLRHLIVENHYSYIPTDQKSLPTLIVFPGCSGIASDDPRAEESYPQLREDDLLFRRHYRTVAEKFKAEGFVVLLVNIHAAEGLLSACSNPISSERIAEYINEAVAWASELPFVDSENINLIGWSMGGGGVLKWLQGPRSGASNVVSAIAVYPSCSGHTTMTIPMPTLILLGGSDDIADPTLCESLVNSVAVKQQITVKKYPRARHGFDIEGAPSVLDIGNGMTVGYQKEAADDSWTAILNFLAMSDEH